MNTHLKVKALPLIVQMLLQGLIFLNIGHGQGHMVWYQLKGLVEEYTCKIYRPYLKLFKCFDRGKGF